MIIKSPVNSTKHLKGKQSPLITKDNKKEVKVPVSVSTLVPAKNKLFVIPARTRITPTTTTTKKEVVKSNIKEDIVLIKEDIKKLVDRLSGIEKDIPSFLEKFDKSALANEIRPEELSKYDAIVEALKDESLYQVRDEIFMKRLAYIIGPWGKTNQAIYYKIIHARAISLGTPIKNSRDYYAYILQYI